MKISFGGRRYHPFRYKQSSISERGNDLVEPTFDPRCVRLCYVKGGLGPWQGRISGYGPTVTFVRPESNSSRLRCLLHSVTSTKRNISTPQTQYSECKRTNQRGHWDSCNTSCDKGGVKGTPCRLGLRTSPTWDTSRVTQVYSSRTRDWGEGEVRDGKVIIDDRENLKHLVDSSDTVIGNRHRSH